MDKNDKICPFCRSYSYCYSDEIHNLDYYNCPVCGKFEIYNDKEEKNELDFNKTASFLYYNRFLSSKQIDYCKYHTVRSKDECDGYNKQYNNGNNQIGRPVHMDREIIDLWYPKIYSERIEYIVKYLGKFIPHVGQTVYFSCEETFSLLFVDRYEKYNDGELLDDNDKLRNEDECCYEAKYMLDSLKESFYINYKFIDRNDKNLYVELQLTPKGYSFFDELQKNTSNGKFSMVAMKFGDDTKQLREAIRDGISKAGYIAVFIDEVQHNDFITPELLKYIKNSKFLVVDLTHENNGAYFEEGYAMGLGKSVIQLCKKDTKLHFDIAQKNTIMWQTENDIPEMLCNRIKATID